MKEAKQISPELIEMAKKTLMETPLHMLVLFSAGKVSFEMGHGLVDLMNGHIFKGFKKIKRNGKNKS